MNIPYVYSPALHDLFLYQPETVTWTAGGGGSAIVPAPYAWNPNSLLYGYRGSLQGLMACYRWMGTPGGIGNPGYEAFNDSSLPVNKPAYYNSYPPACKIIHPSFGWVCHHAVGAAYNTRDTTKVFDDLYGIGSSQAAGFSHRYLKPDNTIVQLSGTTLGFPYQRDDAYNPNPNFYISAPGGGDIGVFELPAPFSAEPLQTVDPRTIYPGAKIWCIDGSQKICDLIEYRQSGWVQTAVNSNAGEGKFWVAETTSGLGYNLFMHDSGSTFFVELQPPTSPAAGDGILASLPGTVLTSTNLSKNNPGGSAYTPGCVITPGREQSNRVIDYWTSRGYPQYPWYVDAPRGNQALATQTECSALLADMQAFNTIMQTRN
jgi:hypothetical protein